MEVWFPGDFLASFKALWKRIRNRNVYRNSEKNIKNKWHVSQLHVRVRIVRDIKCNSRKYSDFVFHSAKTATH